MNTMGTRVMVVEDDEIILEFLEMVFASETMEVIRTRSGAHGLEVAERYKPDVIVCDLHMAGMTGFEVLEQIRERPSTANIPFVLITADQSPALRDQSFERGADAFVLKPFDPDQLIETLRHLSRRDRGPARPVHRPPGPQPRQVAGD